MNCSGVGWWLTLVDLLCSEYGWSLDAVLDIAVARALCLRGCHCPAQWRGFRRPFLFRASTSEKPIVSNGVEYNLRLNNSGFNGPLTEARSSLGGFKTFSVGSMAVVGAAVAGAALAVKGLHAAWTEAKAAVGEAADRETMQTAFIPLLGSAKAAKDRMMELADFAAHTPFQLPEIAAASRTLETLTDGALSTGQGLTMVGDVASGTNTPFEELAVTIGRLYSGLDSGRPVGEAMQRLQEVGAITPEVRTKLEKLQAEGKKGSEVWRVAAEDLARFSGGMELQSQTWNGKLSTLGDAWSEVRAQFGEPIMDALKPLLDDGISTIENMAVKAREIGETIAYAMRFMIEAFKQGEAWNLAKLGLTLAFQESVNFLWRTLMGAFQAIPQFLIQAFKTGVMVFDILTDAAFWGMVGNAFVGVMRTAVNGILALLSEGIANLIEYIPGMGKQAAWMHGLSREFEKDADQGAAQAGGAASHLLIPTATAFLDRLLITFPPYNTPFPKVFPARRMSWTPPALKPRWHLSATASREHLKNRMRHGLPKKRKMPPRVNPSVKKP